MVHKRTLVIAGAILAWGASLEAGTSVGYFLDGIDANGLSHATPDHNGPAGPITANGFTAVQILDLDAFVLAGNLSTISILTIYEISVGGNNPSAALLRQAPALSNWVAGGGVLAIHDRNVCAGVCTPVPGICGVDVHVCAGITLIFDQGNDIDVATPTLVTNGPFGVIGNLTLDGGPASDHGFVLVNTLPAGAVAIFHHDIPQHIITFSYRFGLGAVYYSTIPLDFYLDPTIPAATRIPVAFGTIYAPNMVAYLGCLAGVSTCSLTVAPGAATAAPTLSEWGLGILAILLMGCAAVMLRQGQAKGPAR
jgi:IPTL-CTERM motif